MEDITDGDLMYAKRVRKDFEIKNLDFYLKRDTLILADVSKNFRNFVSKFII